MNTRDLASLFQFSIRSLLLAVTIAALGIAALLNANAWWESLAWGAALIILSCAALLVVYRRDRQRAFWLGFVVFGGMYLALLLYSFTADLKNEPIPFSPNPLHYNSLATTKVTALAYESVIPTARRQEYVSTPADGGAPLTMNSDGGMTGQINSYWRRMTGDVASIAFSPDGTRVTFTTSNVTPNPSYIPPGKFISIGHMLWLLMIAAIGGKVCQVIDRTRPRETQA